ncbi:MAG: cytochrome P450 [Chloroflexi bacterium]|nr:cytochrome P450 [Chloroflexota bacterium]
MPALDTESLQGSRQVPTHNGVPFVGSVPALFAERPFDFLSRLARDEGDFVKLKLGPKVAFLVSNPDYLQRILRDNHHNYRKPQFLYQGVASIMGNGLAVSSGDFWLRQRRMIQPYLHRKYVTGLTDLLTQAIDDYIKDWGAEAEHSTPIDIFRYMKRLTINVIARAIFGTGLSAADLERVEHDFPLIMDQAGMRTLLGFLPNWLPLPGEAEFQSAMGNLHRIVMTIIEERRTHHADADDLITMLLHAVDEETNTQMTDTQLYDEVRSLFVAGFETTANAMAYLWYLLDQPENQPVADALQAELAAVLGGRLPTAQDLRALTYTRNVFQEAMRIYPPIGWLPRIANEADHLGDHAIPKGAIMLLYMYGLHHNPAVWDQPAVFNPQRFAAEHSDKRSPFAYLPFSAGPRQCVGNEFALIEGTLITAIMFQRYRVRFLPDQALRLKFTGFNVMPAQVMQATLQTV